jgi:elongation factor P
VVSDGRYSSPQRKNAQILHSYEGVLMAALNDLRNGLVIRLDDIIYTMVHCQHVKPGKGNAFARTKLKRVADGAVIDRTFRASDTVETVRLEEREMQYMYRDGNLLYFMDNENFDQHSLSEEFVGDGMKFLKEGETVKIKIDGIHR